MATTNPFDLLGEFDSDDPSQVIAAQTLKPAPSEKKAPVQSQSGAAAKPAKLPSKPLPPAQAVKEAKNENSRGGGRGGGHGYGRGRGGGGFNRDFANNENVGNNNSVYGGYKPAEDGEAGQPYEKRGYGAPRGSYRGPRRVGFNNGDAADGERSRRPYERRSGTGRGNEIKRDGAGRGNWGTVTDEIAPVTEETINDNDKAVEAEKQVVQEDAVADNKDSPVNEAEQKEPEDKEMTLEEYEKVLEERRKALLSLKTEERKVAVDKEFESMQLLSNKRSDDDIFVKLGSDKDKRKDGAEKEEKAKKSVSINDFLKPAVRERYGGSGGRRGGRGRGPRDGLNGRNMVDDVAAPSIDDVGQFPSLCTN